MSYVYHVFPLLGYICHHYIEEKKILCPLLHCLIYIDRLTALVEAIKKKQCHCKTSQSVGKNTKSVFGLCMLGSLHPVAVKKTELFGDLTMSDKFYFSTVIAQNFEGLLILQAEKVSNESLTLHSITFYYDWVFKKVNIDDFRNSQSMISRMILSFRQVLLPDKVFTSITLQSCDILGILEGNYVLQGVTR